MVLDFKHATLGKTNLKAFRLGLSATYMPGKKTIYKAVDLGINYFFAFGFDRQMTKHLPAAINKNRESNIIATGAYNYIWRYQNMQQALEKRLQQFKTDYIDIFLFLGVLQPKEFDNKIQDELLKLKESGKVKFVGIACHNRKFFAELLDKNILDVFMLRYNAAHRGAEAEIFPYLYKSNPGVVSYTATRWSFLIREPSLFSKVKKIPTAPDCYRFVLSNKNVDVCLTAPRSVKELEENVKSLELGEMNEDEMSFMKNYGDLIHNQKRWFM